MWTQVIVHYLSFDVCLCLSLFGVYRQDTLYLQSSLHITTFWIIVLFLVGFHLGQGSESPIINHLIM